MKNIVIIPKKDWSGVIADLCSKVYITDIQIKDEDVIVTCVSKLLPFISEWYIIYSRTKVLAFYEKEISGKVAFDLYSKTGKVAITKEMLNEN